MGSTESDIGGSYQEFIIIREKIKTLALPLMSHISLSFWFMNKLLLESLTWLRVPTNLDNNDQSCITYPQYVVHAIYHYSFCDLEKCHLHAKTNYILLEVSKLQCRLSNTGAGLVGVNSKET